MGTSVASSSPLNGGICTLSTTMMTRAIVLFAVLATVAQGLVDIEWKFFPKPLKKCAEVGEEVTFNWGGNGHNVVEVNSKKDFDDCTGFEESDDGERGPVTVSFDKTGKYYFVCGVGGHCQHGNQKVEVIVRPSCKSDNPGRNPSRG